VTSSLTSRGVPAGRAAQEAASISQFQGGSSRTTTSIPHFIRLDFTAASRSVFYAMAIFMAVAAIVALVGLRSGRQEEPGGQPGSPGDAARAAGEGGVAAVPPGRGPAPGVAGGPGSQQAAAIAAANSAGLSSGVK
jgi:hypothetical protein